MHLELRSSFFVFPFYALAQTEAPQPSTELKQETTDKFISVDLFKRNDNYEIRGLDLIMEKFNYLSDYKNWKGNSNNGRVVSFRDKDLGYFSVNSLTTVICGDGFDADGNLTGGCEELPEGDILVQLPFFPNGKYADIFDPSGKKVLTIDLSSKATCNENGQCDRPIEDGENCPQDCKKNEPKIDPAVVQTAANNQAATQEAEKKISLADLGWWGIAILIVLLAGGGIGYWVYRRNRGYQE